MNSGTAPDHVADFTTGSLRTHQPGQAMFRSVLPEDIDWRPFTACQQLRAFGSNSASTAAKISFLTAAKAAEV